MEIDKETTYSLTFTEKELEELGQLMMMISWGDLEEEGEFAQYLWEYLRDKFPTLIVHPPDNKIGILKPIR